jgi:hypothetical protein
MTKEQPMVSLKDFASKEGLAEENIRKYLENGEIKGEKKGGWFRDEWYISPEELERLKLNPEFKSRRSKAREERKAQKVAKKFDPAASSTALAQLLTPESEDGEESAAAKSAWINDYRRTVKAIAEEFLRPLLERLEVQSILLEEKDHLIKEQAAQLRLLPDFRKQAEAGQAVAQEKEREARELQEKLDVSEQKSRESEVQLTETEQQLAVLRSQKETELNELRAELGELHMELTKLRNPWWKKLFQV